MAFADLVKDVTTSSGTGATVTLSGSPTAPYRALSAVGAPGSGLTFDYAMKDATQFEIGTATLGATANTFTRGPVISSNGNAAVNFAAGVEFIVTTNAATLATFLTAAGTATLTNKRITPRTTVTSSPGATPSFNTDTTDHITFQAVTVAITSMTTNLTGTPTRGETRSITFQATGIVAIAWGSKYASSGSITLPTGTINGRVRVFLEWDPDLATPAWVCVGVA